VLGREDVLEIAVWKDPALSTTAPVRPDGRVGVPMIGDVQAEGRTPHELSEEIQKRLAPLVKDPVVAVIVREVNSRKFAIVGEVAHPGVYPMRGQTSLLHAVALAGGLTEFASKDDITVLRKRKDGKDVRLSVDLEAGLQDGGHAFTLRPGDTVYVH
jgi:polysaccharide export outer membrane protein